MKNITNFKIKNVKLAFVILIVVLFVIFLIYYKFILLTSAQKNIFTNQMIEIADENENSVFNIQKILLYSNATATDNSSDQSLSDISISQYSDISIYIDNTSYITDITNENTVKQLYIDDIIINSNSDKGSKILNYKNPLNFGKYINVEKPANNRIDFNIINTNSENEEHDYTLPTFYTDCSNPISLGYLNKDLLTNYSVSDNVPTLSYNGKVLKEANIDLNDVNYTLTFKIHIINNSNQKFVYNMSLNVKLDDDNGGICNGYVYRGKTTTGNEYRFFKEI